MKEKGNQIEYYKRFIELKCIGRGNFGTVHLVRSKLDHLQYIAKKIILDGMGEKEVEAAFKEADLLKKMQHPNIVFYKASFVDHNLLIIVMEYCGGGDIATIIKNRAKEKELLSEDEIMHFFVQICLALQYIHGLRILHRDLKASNIFLTVNNCVKLGDFGISKVLQSTLEAAMTIVGTPYYMSPEVCQNKPYTLKSDIWALGCVLYEMCTLRHPFVGENLLSLAYKIAKEEYDPLPEVYTQELCNLVTAMLLKDGTYRPTINEVLNTPIIQRHLSQFVHFNETLVKTEFELSSKSPKQTGRVEHRTPSERLLPEIKSSQLLTAKERILKKKEEETKKKIEELNLATKQSLFQREEAKIRKQNELASDIISPTGSRKTSTVEKSPSVKPISETKKEVKEIQQSFWTYLEECEESSVFPPPEVSTITISNTFPEFLNEEEIDPDLEYPEDFEEESDSGSSSKKSDEMQEIADHCKAILAKNVEEKAKEKEEFAKIEREQKTAVVSTYPGRMRERCVALLGLELFNLIYAQISAAKDNNIKFEKMQMDLKALLQNDKEKMNCAFLIDQIVDCERPNT